MKTLLTMLLLATMAVAVDVIPEIRTLDGKVYKQVKVTKQDAGEVRILHAEGFATVRLSTLTPESLVLFGGKVDKKAEAMADAERELARARAYAPVVTAVPSTPAAPTASATSQVAVPISAEENARRAWDWYQWCLANPNGDAQINQQQRDTLLMQATQTLQAWEAQQQQAAQPRMSGSLADRGTRQVGRSMYDPQRIAERMAKQQAQAANADWSVWHSVLANVCHNNPGCTTGNNIETENLAPGPGGRPLCEECQRLNLAAQGIVVPQIPKVPAIPQVPGVPQVPAARIYVAEAGAWNSSQQSVCHNNPGCTTGNNIERGFLQMGTGGKPLCQECARLNATGR